MAIAPLSSARPEVKSEKRIDLSSESLNPRSPISSAALSESDLAHFKQLAGKNFEDTYQYTTDAGITWSISRDKPTGNMIASIASPEGKAASIFIVDEEGKVFEYCNKRELRLSTIIRATQLSHRVVTRIDREKELSRDAQELREKLKEIPQNEITVLKTLKELSKTPWVKEAAKTLRQFEWITRQAKPLSYPVLEKEVRTRENYYRISIEFSSSSINISHYGGIIARFPICSTPLRPLARLGDALSLFMEPFNSLFANRESQWAHLGKKTKGVLSSFSKQTSDKEIAESLSQTIRNVLQEIERNTAGEHA